MLGRRAVERAGWPGLAQASGGVVIDFDDGLRRHDLRMLDHLAAPERRRAWHVMRFEAQHPLGRRPGLQHLLSHQQALVDVLVAGAGVAKRSSASHSGLSSALVRPIHSLLLMTATVM